MGKNMKVKVIFTCFNRKDKTVQCVKTLLNNKAEISFIIVDDNSSDGTVEVLEQMNFNKIILHGSGSLFWAGGMRVGIGHALSEDTDADYILLVNDDVVFNENVVDRMIEQSVKKNGAVIVGNCCDLDGQPTYGAIKFNSALKSPMYIHLKPKEFEKEADTFNCNAVLIPIKAMKTIGNFDSVYTHSFADYDYGFMLKKKGFHIYGTPFFVGTCSDDKLNVSWMNRNLPRKQRMQLKESPKGLPQKEWNHFLLKNLGIKYFVRYAYTAKLKIWLGI